MARATQASLAAWRGEIERKYGSELPPESWEYLVGRRWIEELEDGLVSVDDIVDELRVINRAAPAARARSRKRVVERSEESHLFDGINDRMQAIAEMVALRAGQSSGVRNFRRLHLPNGLIEAGHVTSWIDDAYRRELPSDWPDSPGPNEATNFRGKFATWPPNHKVLEWLNDGNPTSQVWCVPTTGPLAELADLSQKLAEAWDWSVPLATAFILTGKTPARPGVRGISFRRRAGYDEYYGGYEYMSVRCLIDIEVTPEELAAWWRGVRSSIGIKGRRPIGDKSISLALFALSREEGTTWRDDMLAWNNQCRPDWRFKDYAAYRTAALKALDALNRPAAAVEMP
jgi:hypothetical protein